MLRKYRRKKLTSELTRERHKESTIIKPCFNKTEQFDTFMTLINICFTSKMMINKSIYCNKSCYEAKKINKKVQRKHTNQIANCEEKSVD